MEETKHIPVLLEETLREMHLTKGMKVVDATLGGGGHTRALLRNVLPGGTVIAFDADLQAIERFRGSIKADADLGEVLADGSLLLEHRNYSDMGGVLEQEGITTVDAILADLGFSSDQIESSERGFSFSEDGPLDMRLDRNTGRTAAMLVGTLSLRELERTLREYGDETEAHRIAQAIVCAREERPIETTGALREIIEHAYPAATRRKLKIHPATRTFQALRIAVNDEYGHLETFLRESLRHLRPGGRLAVITFHSGEDRIVKHFFQEAARGCICPPDFPVCRCGNRADLRIITKKPVIPDSSEISANPRSRSAKLRVAEKL